MESIVLTILKQYLRTVLVIFSSYWGTNFSVVANVKLCSSNLCFSVIAIESDILENGVQSLSHKQIFLPSKTRLEYRLQWKGNTQ